MRPGAPRERYGPAHVKMRKLLIGQYLNGFITACALCNRGLPKPGTVKLSTVQLAHDGEHPGQWKGLSHAACNNAGALRVRANRIEKSAVPAQGRDWANWDCAAGDPVNQQYGITCRGHGPGSGSAGRCW